MGGKRRRGWGCKGCWRLWLEQKGESTGPFSPGVAGAKTHMALDMHLQGQSASCKLARHCLPEATPSRPAEGGDSQRLLAKGGSEMGWVAEASRTNYTPPWHS